MTRYELTSRDEGFTVEIRRTERGTEGEINGRPFVAMVRRLGNSGRYAARIGDETMEFAVLRASPSFVTLSVDGEKMSFARSFSKADVASVRVRRHADSDLFAAPMPGTVVRIIARPGRAVRQGDPLLVVESMKMESVFRSGREGIVAEVEVREGDSVKKGQGLLRFRPTRAGEPVTSGQP